LIATNNGFAAAAGAVVAAGAAGGCVAAGAWGVGVPPQAVRIMLTTINNVMNSELFFILSPPRDIFYGTYRLVLNQLHSFSET
jgi:hypothetical protein